MRYLQHTRFLSLTLNGNKPLKVELWTDASYAECVDTRKSTTGLIVTLCESLLCAKSEHQPTVAISSCEAELYAQFEGVMNLVHIERILIFLDILKPDTTIIHRTDSKSAIDLLHRQSPDKRSKHIDVRFFRLKECQDNNLIKQEYEPTGSMIADLLTKALPASRHYVLTYALLNGLIHKGLEEVCLLLDKTIIIKSEIIKKDTLNWKESLIDVIVEDDLAPTNQSSL